MTSISFSGIDGSGKSTQCQRLFQYFQNLGIEVHSFHIGEEYKTLGSQAQSLPIINKIHQKLRDLSGKGILGVLKLFIGMHYYLFDSWITYFIHQIKYRNQLVIFDRYYYDFLVIFAANFPTIPWWVINCIKLVPRSNVGIIMEVPLQVARQRRPGHDFDQLQRYYQLYQKVAAILKIQMINGMDEVAIIEEKILKQCLAQIPQQMNIH